MSEFTDSFLKDPNSTINGIILGAHPELITDPDQSVSERIVSAFQEFTRNDVLTERFQYTVFKWLYGFQQRHQTFSRDYSALVLHEVLSAARRSGMSELANKMTEDSEYFGRWFASYCFATRERKPFLEFCRLLRDIPGSSVNSNWNYGQIPYWRSVILFDWHSDYDASALSVLTYSHLVSSPPKVEDFRLDLFAICSQHALIVEKKFGTQARKGWLAVWSRAFCQADVEPDTKHLGAAPEDWRDKLRGQYEVERTSQRTRRPAIDTTPSNIVELPFSQENQSNRA